MSDLTEVMRLLRRIEDRLEALGADIAALQAPTARPGPGRSGPVLPGHLPAEPAPPEPAPPEPAPTGPKMGTPAPRRRRGVF